MNIDTNRLLQDRAYRELIKEYYGFVHYVLQQLGSTYKLESSNVEFNKESIIYEYKDQFISMIKNTFPTFTVEFCQAESNEDSTYRIKVMW
jgi:hypothetical protein